MRTVIIAASFIAISCASARAQTVVFQDGFENGFANWTASGFWNPVVDANTCMTSTTPFPEGATAAWYGNPATCNYVSAPQPNGGTLELVPWIQLPSNVASITLYYESAVYTEYCRNNYDWHWVQIYAQNGPNSGFVEPVCQYPNQPDPFPPFTFPWHERRVDLTAYAGAQVRFAFTFGTGDIFLNDTLGWLVDDVRIVTEPGVPYCPSAHPLTFCPCARYYGWGGGCNQSDGRSATLMSGGQASVGSDSLIFTAAHMPIGTMAVLFQGTLPVTATTPFGDGLMCVSGTMMRMGTSVAPNGSLTWPLSTTHLSVTGAVPPAGGDRYYQTWFRDIGVHCTAATFNLTSAEKVSWTP